MDVAISISQMRKLGLRTFGNLPKHIVITCVPNAAAAAAKLLQSCLTLCDPMDCSLLGSSVPEILQARILEWVAVSSPVHESEK